MSVSCSICINSFEEEPNKEVVAVKCGHAFHKTCLAEWKLSSKQMTCPECRMKYTDRSLKRLYLNVVPKDDEFHTGKLFDQLQEQRKLAIEAAKARTELQRDKDRLEFENMRIKYELTQSRQDQAIKLKELTDSHALKVQAYSIISGINDKYINELDELRDENTNLKRRLKDVSDELEAKKAKTVNLAKPFVDLTNDDDNDSDVEVISDSSTPKCQNFELNLSEDSDVEETSIAKEEAPVPKVEETSIANIGPPSDYFLDYKDLLVDLPPLGFPNFF